MSQWAQRRKLYYGTGVFIFLAVLLSVPIYSALHKSPTCFDGVMNQGETAVDKGGPCQLLDEAQLDAPHVLWARVIPVREGVSNAIIYIENPNSAAGARAVPYQVKLYDDKNIIVAERTGVLNLIPKQVIPIFEGGLQTGNRTPIRAFFTFLEEPVWERMEDPTVGITVRNIRITGVDTSPRIEAEVHNANIGPRTSITIVASVFDDTGNAFAGSRTVVDRLDAGERATVTFTWPTPFARSAARADIVPTGAAQ